MRLGVELQRLLYVVLRAEYFPFYVANLRDLSFRVTWSRHLCSHFMYDVSINIIDDSSTSTHTRLATLQHDEFTAS